MYNIDKNCITYFLQTKFINDGSLMNISYNYQNASFIYQTSMLGEYLRIMVWEYSWVIAANDMRAYLSNCIWCSQKNSLSFSPSFLQLKSGHCLFSQMASDDLGNFLHKLKLIVLIFPLNHLSYKYIILNEREMHGKNKEMQILTE